MGAQQYSIVVVGKTPKDAYEKVVEKYTKTHGDNNYNGTISTSDGAVLVNNKMRYGTKAYWKWVDEKWDDLEKWGPAMCKEIKGKHAKKHKETLGLKGKRGIRVFHFFGWAAC
jgi:hypothetical protein